MKRIIQLIQEILAFAEECADGGHTRCVPSAKDLGSFGDINDRDIHYHIGLCEQAGFLVVEKSGKDIPDSEIPWCRIIHLTWEGHEYLDQSRTGNRKRRKQMPSKKVGGR